MKIEQRSKKPKRILTTRLRVEAIDAINTVSEIYSQPKSVVVEELACRFAPVLLAEAEEQLKEMNSK